MPTTVPAALADLLAANGWVIAEYIDADSADPPPPPAVLPTAYVINDTGPRHLQISVRTGAGRSPHPADHHQEVLQ